MPGEQQLVDWIRSQQRAAGIVRLAAGDDLAAMEWPAGELVVAGVDQVLDQVHFDARVHSPEAIGAKAMNRNLSDCAAMGARPAAALACVALPRGAGIDFAKGLYSGMRHAGEKHGCAIVGGDTGTWDQRLAVSVTILARARRVITRGGAKAGDGIYVTGPLGGSILGRHMAFEPRVDLGWALGQSGAVSAMIDLSDGLGRDLAHVCAESGLGAQVMSAQVPVHEDARRLAAQDGKSALAHAVSDGEDYELLFTSAAGIDQVRRIVAGAEVFRIGSMVAGDEVMMVGPDGVSRRVETAGWEHAL